MTVKCRSGLLEYVLENNVENAKAEPDRGEVKPAT